MTQRDEILDCACQLSLYHRELLPRGEDDFRETFASARLLALRGAAPEEAHDRLAEVWRDPSPSSP